MIIKELFLLDAKKSDLKEFFAFLYGQKIHPSFLVFSNLPVDFSRVENDLKVYQLESEDNFYFLLYFHNQPFIVFEINVESSDVKNVFCINREIYRDSIIYISNNLYLLSVPSKDRNSRLK